MIAFYNAEALVPFKSNNSRLAFPGQKNTVLYDHQLITTVGYKRQKSIIKKEQHAPAAIT